MPSPAKVYAVNLPKFGANEPLTTESNNTTAFGETVVAKLTPFVQAQATYNVLPANITSYTATGGSAGASGKEFTCSTGTSVGGYGVVRSFRSVNYKGGMGAVFMGTGRFTAGVANSIQGVGFFNVGDSLCFGYYGTSFGIIYQYGGKPEVRTLTITSGSGGATNATVVLNSVSFSIPLTSGTAAKNAYEIAAYLTANQTAFNCKQNGSTVVCIATTDGAKSGTYSFSHATAAASWAQTMAGITKTTNFIPQTSWNVGVPFAIDPTKGNVFKIQFQYLGYGNIDFFIENPQTGRFVLVHRIKYPNANTTPSLNNSSMHCGLFAASLGSTTNLTTNSACFASFIQGEPGRTRNPRGYSNLKSVDTTPTAIFTLRTREVFNGEPNQIEIEPLILTVFTESTKGAKVQMLSNTTLGGTPNYAYLNETNLVSEIDTAATTVSGGIPIMEFQIPGNSSSTIDLSNMRIRIPPTVYMTIVMNVNSGASSNCGCGMSWYEDV